LERPSREAGQSARVAGRRIAQLEHRSNLLLRHRDLIVGEATARHPIVEKG
jgi:hypothetical protein